MAVMPIRFSLFIRLYLKSVKLEARRSTLIYSYLLYSTLVTQNRCRVSAACRQGVDRKKVTPHPDPMSRSKSRCGALKMPIHRSGLSVDRFRAEGGKPEVLYQSSRLVTIMGVFSPCHAPTILNSTCSLADSKESAPSRITISQRRS